MCVPASRVRTPPSLSKGNGGIIPDREYLSTRIRRDAVLAEEDRRVGFALLEDFRAAAILQEADRLVASLLAQPMFPDEAAKFIRADPHLNAEVRQVGAGPGREISARRLDRVLGGPREVGLQPEAGNSKYRRALDWAEGALTYLDGTAETEGPVLNTIGLLHYRPGQLDKATIALERWGEELDMRNPAANNSAVFDHVILALVAYKSGGT